MILQTFGGRKLIFTSYALLNSETSRIHVIFKECLNRLEEHIKKSNLKILACFSDQAHFSNQNLHFMSEIKP